MTPPQEPPPTHYRFGDVTVECENFRILRGGEALALTPRAFDVLLFLIRHRGRVVEKQEFFEQVWKGEFVTDNALTRAVKEVRRALGDDAEAPLFIETVHRRGYRFIAEVSEGPAAPAAVSDAPASDAPTHAGHGGMAEAAGGEVGTLATAESLDGTRGPRRAARVRGLYWAALACVLAVAALGAFALWRLRAGREPEDEGQVKRTAQVTFSAGFDNFSALSPDGNSVAYSSDQSGGFELYVKQLAPGGREIKLTDDGQQNIEPAWSPDGQLIAFHSMGRGGVWVMPALGGTPRQLTEFGSRPAWSRDGTWVAFQSERPNDLSAHARDALAPSTLWVVPAAGGTPRQVTRPGSPPGGHGAPAFSPDGRRLIFSTGDFNTSSVWSVPFEGGEPVPVISTAADAVYAPDGRHIYYTGRSQAQQGLWSLRVSPETGARDGEPVALVDGGAASIRHPSVSSDGKRITYAALRLWSNLWSVPLSPATGEPAGPPVPFTHDSSIRNNLPAFSPDGSKIAYVVFRTVGAGSIWVADADGRNAAQLTTNPANNLVPDWLPDSQRLTFLSNRGDHFTLWSAPARGGQEKQLLDPGPGVDFGRLSPDGRLYAFNSKASGAINVWLMPLGSDAPARQLTFDGEMMGFPCWSPDGRWLAVELKRGDDQNIAVIPLEGGPPALVMRERGLSWPNSWSPDGTRIAFAGERDGRWNVFWVSRDGRTQRQLTSYDRLNTFVRYPAWSPKGDRIVYEYAESAGNIWLLELK